MIALATPVGDIGSNNGNSASTNALFISGISALTQNSDVDTALTSLDNDLTLENLSLLAALPDDADTPGHIASFYSFATPTTSTSIPPDVTCSAPNNGNPTQGTYRTAVTLGDGESCNITVTPQANGDPYADIFYSGVLSRTGNIYYLKDGNVCGTPFSDCPVLSITTAGTGTGTVTNNSPHGDGRFPINANVTLTATPTAGSVFAGWSGDAGCANSFDIGNANKACIATFNISSSTPPPISASIGVESNQPAVIYSKEIIVTE